ncbi:hypothetical protein COOONC_06074 [Cooperia oncophora]
MPGKRKYIERVVSCRNTLFVCDFFTISSSIFATIAQVVDCTPRSTRLRPQQDQDVFVNFIQPRICEHISLYLSLLQTFFVEIVPFVVMMLKR